MFYHTRFNCFKWAFVCYYLAFFLMLGYFAVYGGLFFMFNLLSHPFIRGCLVQSQFIHIFCGIFYAVFMYSYWPWLIQWYFIILAIILMTYPWSQFLNSNFIVFLAALSWSFVCFILRMASSKSKRIYRFYDKKVVICHPLYHNLELEIWSLLFILVVIKLYARINILKKTR